MSRYHSPTQHRCWTTSCLYIFIFLCLLLQHYWIISGLLFMPGCAHITKLCKDIGKEVDSVFDPNTQRFGSSLEVGHMWKHFQTASAPPALSLGHSLRSVASLENMVRQGVAEKCRKTKSICTFQQFGNASEGR